MRGELMSTLQKIVNLPDEKQERLQKIASEHVALSKLFSRDGLADQQREEIFDRIQALKDERVAILGAKLNEL